MQLFLKKIFSRSERSREHNLANIGSGTVWDLSKKYRIFRMSNQSLVCRYCGNENVIYAGKSAQGRQKCKCKSCGRKFQLSYSYRAYEPGVKEQISEMAINSSGVRDTARVLKIGRSTVQRELKKKPKPSSTSTKRS